MTRRSAFPFQSAALIAFASAAPAFAQTASEDAAADEIVVTGSIAQAQRASIEIKRAADNLTDIAAADAVGLFVDQNSAAALARLPAVAVQRDQGQERYIQVRGAPNRWTSVSIDGIPVTGVDEGGTTRAYRFDAVPSVLLSALAINKSLTPDITAEAIVANIDLRTYSALDNKGFNLQGDLGYGFMNLGKGEQRQGSARLSWANDVVGVVIGGSHYRREQLTDNREVGAYDANGPTELDIRQYELVRENDGLFAAVEYEPVEGQKIYARGIYTLFKDDEKRNQFEFRLDRARSGTRSLAGGDLVSVPVRGSYNLGNYRTHNYIGTIGGEYEADDFKASVNLNYARTENTTYLPLVQASTSGLNSPSLTFDFSRPIFPTVQLFQTVAGATPGSVARGPALASFDQNLVNSGAILLPIVQDSFSDTYTIKIDFEKQWGSFTLSGGFLHQDREIDGFTFVTSTFFPLNLTVGGATPINPAGYHTSRPWDTRFPLGVTFNYVDNARLRSDINAYLGALQSGGAFNPATIVPASNKYDLTERLLAGYLMGKYEFDGGQIVAGMRVESFETVNRGTALITQRNAANTANITVPTPLAFAQTFTDFFPSINARFDLSDRLVWRVAGQRSLARPSFGEIRVGSAVNDTASPGVIGAGNPALKPEYTWGADTSLEYYLPGNGIFSVAGFYRYVDNVLYANTQRVGSDAFDTPGVDRSDYLLTSSFNGEEGKLYGVEINFQQQFGFLPSPFDGFGFQGNVTLLDGEFDTQRVNGVQRVGARFPGMSKRIYNASLFYEKYGISARVSYQYRSNWLDTLGGLGIGAGTGDEFRKGYENVDVSLRYKINEMFTVYADMANLTNAKYIAFEGTPNKPTEVEQIGSRYLFGVRFNF